MCAEGLAIVECSHRTTQSMLEDLRSQRQLSEEQFKEFMEVVKADADLQEKLRRDDDPQVRRLLTDTVVAIAKAAGFVISAGEGRIDFCWEKGTVKGFEFIEWDCDIEYSRPSR